MRNGVRIGAIMGAPVVLTPSWFIIAAVITVLYAPSAQASTGLATGAAFVVAAVVAIQLLVSVFFHEAAHAVTAKLMGSPPHEIVLDIWGGHTTFSSRDSTPGRQALISASGPLTNVALVLLGRALLPLADPGSVPRYLLAALAWSNLILAIFNSIPGLPLDGGRVLESLVWKLTGNRDRGAIVAGWCGRIVAVGIVVWMLWPILAGYQANWTSVIWTLLIASLVWQGAQQAIAGARWNRQYGNTDVTSLLHPAVTIAQETVVADADLERGATVVVDDEQRPVGILDAAAAQAIPQDRRKEVSVSAAMQAIGSGAILREPTDLTDLLQQLQASPNPVYVVRNDADEVVGVLRWGEVATALGG